jgi:hypothetical protein
MKIFTRDKPRNLNMLVCFGILFFSFLLVYYLFGANLNAKWWFIDDHEIMMFLGEDMNLKVGEIPKTLLEKTEVGDFGSYERFRPSYYTLRLIETSIWGNNPGIWYLSRIIILTLFLSILWYLVWQYTDFTKGFLFILLILSASYWTDVISRLGPAETYCVLGLGLYLLGLYFEYRRCSSSKKEKDKTYIYNLILITIGAVIAIGSKENFIVLLFPTALLVLYAIYKRKMNVGLLLSTIIMVSYGAFVMSSVLIALSKTNTDIYGSNIQTKELILMTLRYIPYVLDLFWIKWVIILTTISSLIIFKIKGRVKLKAYGNKLIVFYSSLIFLLGLYLSQYFFYKGAWSTGMRYDFPGMLYYPFYLLSLYLLIRYTLEILEVKKIIQEQIYMLIIVLTFINVSPIQYRDYFRAYTEDNVNRTRIYSETIESIVARSKENSNQAIFFESYSVWDYELLVSVNRFLRAKGVTNEIYINVNNYSLDSFEDMFQKKLSEEILLVSNSGGSLAGELFVEKSGEIQKESGCITLNFSGITEDVCDSYIIR